MAEENSKYDTREKRVVAYLIDSLFTTLPFLIISRNMVNDVTLETDFTSEAFTKITLLSTVTLIIQFAAALYPIIAIYLYGQTIGKKVMDVKVIDLSEAKKISFGQSVMRNSIPLAFAFLALAGYLFDFFELAHFKNNPFISSILSLESDWYSLWLLTELIVMIIEKKHRAIHDFIANTVVVLYEDKTAEAQVL